MMTRQFKHASHPQPLHQNAHHKFALLNTLKVYSSNAAYTMIPKNGCSTLRLSLGMANGCIDGPEHINWIHNNNSTFSMTTESAFLADYSFIILRCPFRRLYSAFLNKIVDIDAQSWVLHKSKQRKIHPHDITFNQFINIISTQKPASQDIHWRPQVDFLLFKQYDDYFCLEQFHIAISTLKERIDLDVHDSRPFLDHDISSMEKHDVPGAANLSAFELLQMKKQGHLPNIESLFSSSAIKKVATTYQEDITLYRQLFGASSTQF